MCLNAWHLISTHDQQQQHTHVRYGAHIYRVCFKFAHIKTTACSLLAVILQLTVRWEYQCVYSIASQRSYGSVYVDLKARIPSVIQSKSHATLIVSCQQEKNSLEKLNKTQTNNSLSKFYLLRNIKFIVKRPTCGGQLHGLRWIEVSQRVLII